MLMPRVGELVEFLIVGKNEKTVRCKITQFNKVIVKIEITYKDGNM